MEKYVKALSRDDISQWLVHFCKPTVLFGAPVSSFDALINILKNGTIYCSSAESILRLDKAGATCFYDVPPQNYKELIGTNPNNRRGHGIIVSKTAFWSKGGRPAIYTDSTNPIDWPESERFRLVHTDLCKSPSPIDWTHEREWRIRGNFTFCSSDRSAYWWPCVETINDCVRLFKEFNTVLTSVCVIELQRVINRSELEL